MVHTPTRDGVAQHGIENPGAVYWNLPAPALYEAGFVSAAHSEADLAATLAAAREAVRL